MLACWLHGDSVGLTKRSPRQRIMINQPNYEDTVVEQQAVEGLSRLLHKVPACSRRRNRFPLILNPPNIKIAAPKNFRVSGPQLKVN